MERRVRIHQKLLLLRECGSDKLSKRPDSNRPLLFMFLVTLVPVVVCGVFGAIYFLYFLPSEDLPGTGIDTDSEPWIPAASIPDLMPLPPEFVPNDRPAWTTRKHAVVPGPSKPGANPPVCSTSTCRIAGQWIRTRINESVDPCQNFYDYTQLELEFATINYAEERPVPNAYQGFEEKAVAMFQGCVAFVKANVSEAHYLMEWMILLGLDLHRVDKMEKMNPVETIVRCSLDLGIPAVFEIRTDNKYILNGKRVLWDEVIIEEHMSRLLAVRPVHNLHDIERLRTLYDELQSGVRSLEALGVASSAYGVLLLTVLRKSIPHELCLEYYRKKTTSEAVPEDDLQEFLNFLKVEVESRERAQRAVRPVPDAAMRQKAPITGDRHQTPSASALTVTGGEEHCTFCDQEGHTAASCLAPHSHRQEKGGDVKGAALLQVRETKSPCRRVPNVEVAQMCKVLRTARNGRLRAQPKSSAASLK
ncbi:hypothetical protein MTO96_023458 [Rhipicephalus appendiculatus]